MKYKLIAKNEKRTADGMILQGVYHYQISSSQQTADIIADYNGMEFIETFCNSYLDIIPFINSARFNGCNISRLIIK